MRIDDENGMDKWTDRLCSFFSCDCLPLCDAEKDRQEQQQGVLRGR